MVNAGSVTLLVVDDMPDNVAVLFGFLRNAGFTVLVAQDGEAAIQVLEHARPDLILLDVMMPGMDGFMVCQRLKSDENTREIPIIFMTALTDTVDKVKGFKLGAADYITKPIHHEEVLARINAHVQLRQQQQYIQIQNNELQVRNKELDTFAHMVAHDLKNPLNGIIMITRLLHECLPAGTVVDGKVQERLAVIERAGDKMLSIINALLLLAGVSNQKQVEMHPVDMHQIIAPMVQNRLAQLVKLYNAHITLPEQWCIALGYTPWIEEVWVNYLSNGLKYGGTPPQLVIGSDLLANGMVRFWVRDSGQGLTPQEQNRLFTPFTRLQTSRVDGHGIGLSIVKQIVEKLGGTVGVESEKGQGSLFYFTLPACN
ncbi:sensor histidine kinase [Beggiatoa leptomitoformis]|uniref:histidine kinase n=1 Tax=Beggiatoa leptomitoformis TaxID=288004 RepID=A0A2N9YEY7_9GAMM|nr:hybrid sensor histidine kinase/response regulator [Beggiatoa leptomitoformis]ALG68663.1 response regulator [Beggiatoa leptomitoformis]AUI68985.1 response regulator [Beggiatoa leptomitoformis]